MSGSGPAECFDAPNDGDALMTAVTLHHGQRNPRDGYEIWHRDRLVFRHPAGKPDASPGKAVAVAAVWPIDRASLCALVDLGLSETQIGAYFAVPADDVHMLREQFGLGPRAYR
jgi:hypothetical protein